MGTEIASKLPARNRSGAGRLSVARVSHTFRRSLPTWQPHLISCRHSFHARIGSRDMAPLSALYAMHHVAQQNASDVKLSATGKELVTFNPVS